MTTHGVSRGGQNPKPTPGAPDELQEEGGIFHGSGGVSPSP